MKKIILTWLLITNFPSLSWGYFVFEPSPNPQVNVSETLPSTTLVPSLEPNAASVAIEEIQTQQNVTIQPDALKPLNVEVIAQEPVQSLLIETLPFVPLISPAFTLTSGSLKTQIQHYLEANGYTLVWNIKKDYLMEAPATFTGNIDEVLNQLFFGLNANNIKLKVRIYDQNKTVEVLGY